MLNVVARAPSGTAQKPRACHRRVAIVFVPLHLEMQCALGSWGVTVQRKRK